LTRFSIVTRDEVWTLGAGPALLEERLIHGRAESTATRIDARDALDEELLALCDEGARRARDTLEALPEGRARMIASARRAGPFVRTEAWLNITVGDLSIISSPEHVAVDYERLIELASIRSEISVAYRGLPIVWKNGSAAVLLHEAAGHAAEHLHAPIRWASWLSARDEPPFEMDDGGQPAAASDLLAGQPPRALRRQSFADVPLPRMSNVVVRQKNAAIGGSGRRIDVHLVAGGSYEPLTEIVTLRVSAADLVDGDRVSRLQPFEIVETRHDIAASIRGAAGEPTRYPGVVCSREGQEIVVGSSAPAVLTVF
jgi:hypothetical protein